jgi:transcriptional regulator with XRE-family HTH domain
MSESAVRAAEIRLRKRLARNVKGCREAMGLTPNAAAERAGMHWRHWRKIEAAELNATIGTLRKLSKALGVDPFTLLCEPPERSAARGARPRREKGSGKRVH